MVRSIPKVASEYTENNIVKNRFYSNINFNESRITKAFFKSFKRKELIGYTAIYKRIFQHFKINDVLKQKIFLFILSKNMNNLQINYLTINGDIFIFKFDWFMNF